LVKASPEDVTMMELVLVVDDGLELMAVRDWRGVWDLVGADE
jgi:hypothetical protein